MNKFKHLELHEFCIFGLFCLIVLFGLTVGVNFILASPEITHCYVHYSSFEGVKHYKLYGSRSWQPDVYMGSFTTFNEAVEAAKLAECPLLKK